MKYFCMLGVVLYTLVGAAVFILAALAAYLILEEA